MALNRAKGARVGAWAAEAAETLTVAEDPRVRRGRERSRGAVIAFSAYDAIDRATVRRRIERV
jgi:hypothetical protein